MRRILLLLTTVALALLLVGGVATSKQRQVQNTSQSPTSDKSSGNFSVQSTTVKASFSRGTGENFLGVKVSNHGNLLSFESPAGQEQVFNSSEGYVLCTNSGDTSVTHGHDTGTVEGGFGRPKFSQPTAGAFPLIVTRNTTDGKFQLKQVWAKPDAIEKDVTVTMTVKNLSNSTVNDVRLQRSGDFDVGSTSSDRGARTTDSVWQWDDSDGPEFPAVGLRLSALTFGTPHFPTVMPQGSWANVDTGDRRGCTSTAVSTPSSVQDLAMRINYNIGNLNAGQSKSVKYEYGRM